MMQATVRSFDPATGSGSVFLDDGTVAGFGAAAFAGSGLRLLRPGQRVAIGCDSGGAIVSLTLATFPLPGAADHDARPATGQNAEPAAGHDAEPAAGQDAEPAAGPGAPPGTAGQDPAPG
jgi:cold shock CspA family protein